MNNLNGMPIQFLNGIEGGTQGTIEDIDLQYQDVLSGVDLLNGIEGIEGFGNPYMQPLSKANYASAGTKSPISMSASKGMVNDTAMFDYLVKTRNVIAAKPYLVKNQDPKTAVKMLDYAIQYWHTPQKDIALDILEKEEQKLMGLGAIQYPVENGEPLEGFFSKVKKAVSKAVQKTHAAIKNTVQKVVNAIKRFNPISITIRAGILAAMNMNMGQMSTRLYPAINPAGFSLDVIRASNEAYDKIKNLFVGKFSGKESNMQKAIRKGYGRKWTKRPPQNEEEVKQSFMENANEVADNHENETKEEQAATTMSGLGNPLLAAEAASKAGSIITQILKIITDAFGKVKEVKDKVDEVKSKVDEAKSLVNQTKDVFKVDRSGENTDTANNVNVPQAYNPASQSAKTYDEIESRYIDQNQKTMPETTETMNNPNPSFMDKIKKNIIPIGLGVAAVGAAIYFMTRKKKGVNGLNGLDGTRKRRKKKAAPDAKVVKVLALAGPKKAKKKTSAPRKKTRKARRVRVR